MCLQHLMKLVKNKVPFPGGGGSGSGNRLFPQLKGNPAQGRLLNYYFQQKALLPCFVSPFF